MKALVVCHAGKGIGLGHLSRSLVLATAFRERFATDLELLIQGEEIARPDLANFSHRFISPLTALGGIVVDAVSNYRPWLVVLDLHPQRVPEDLLRVLVHIRNCGGRVVGIDGLLRYRSQLDLVFLPSLRCDDPLAQGPGTPVVYGLDCFLTPEGRRSNAWSPGSEVLILTGGSDQTGLGAEWPAILDEMLPSGARPSWVQGPYAQDPQLPISPRLVWSVHHSPSGLKQQMNLTNYALTIFGVSFFELLKMGVPTVVFSPYGAKDFLDMQYIAKAGIALVANDERDAVEQMKKLMQDENSARDLSLRAETSMIDAGGARLCELVALWHSPDATH
jgi:spore coat polysaccharide biosynthesis predicted glycosyltransferase SpsG